MKKQSSRITNQLIMVTAIATVLASSIFSYVVSTTVANDKIQMNTLSEVTMSGKVLVHLSSGVEEPHALMMGLQKALKAREAGSEVFLFMDVKATDLALKSTNITYADFPQSQTLISDLIEKGVEVYVCPHCLMVNGNNMDEVQTGIQELTMEAMMNFSSGNGVVTLDY